MTLVDLRKLAIRKQSKIRFALRNGMECVISEDGIARVPALKSVPDFNLEQELAARHGVRRGSRGSGRDEEPAKAEARADGPPELAAMALDSPGGALPYTTNTTTSNALDPPAALIPKPCIRGSGDTPTCRA